MKNAAHPRILVVEDDESTRWVIGQSLQHLSVKVDILYAKSANEGKTSLEKNHVDLVICDYHMGDANGLEVLKFLRDAHTETPFILYTSELSSNIPHVSYMKYTYVQKPEMNGLLDEIERWIKA